MLLNPILPFGIVSQYFVQEAKEFLFPGLTDRGGIARTAGGNICIKVHSRHFELLPYIKDSEFDGRAFLLSECGDDFFDTSHSLVGVPGIHVQNRDPEMIFMSGHCQMGLDVSAIGPLVL